MSIWTLISHAHIHTGTSRQTSLPQQRVRYTNVEEDVEGSRGGVSQQLHTGRSLPVHSIAVRLTTSLVGKAFDNLGTGTV